MYCIEDIFEINKKEGKDIIITGLSLKIMSRLYLCCTRENSVYTTVDRLLNECGYKSIKENKVSVNNILNNLKENKLIDYKEYNMSSDIIFMDVEGIIRYNWKNIVECDMLINSGLDIRKISMLIKIITCIKTNNDNISLEDICLKVSISKERLKEHIECLIKLGCLKRNVIDIENNNNENPLSSYELRFILMMEKYNIKYSKENKYKEFIPNLEKNYRFDFVLTIDNVNYFIEIFGLMNKQDYMKKAIEKVRLCKENNLKLIDFYPSDFYNGNIKSLYDNLINRISIE